MDYYVAFLDILGYKILVDNYFESKESSLLEKIGKIIDSAFELDELILKKHNSRLIFVSDSLMLFLKAEDSTYEDLHWIYTFLSYVQSRCLMYGILLRGGVSCGKFYSQESDNYEIIFSQGLNKSVQIEKDQAIYPRIIVDNDLVKKYGDRLKSEVFLNIEDNLYFIDFYHGLLTWSYFDKEKKPEITLISIINNIILYADNEIKKNSNNKIKEKYLWIIDYLTWRYYRNREVSDKDMVQVKNCRNFNIAWVEKTK